MRPIDADKLIQELSTMYKQPTSSEDFMTVGYDKAIADVVVTTHRQPTADVTDRKVGKWNNHEVACIIADLFGDACACNFNDIDEWLPRFCEFANNECPNPGGVACWEQYLKWKGEADG